MDDFSIIFFYSCIYLVGMECDPTHCDESSSEFYSCIPDAYYGECENFPDCKQFVSALKRIDQAAALRAKWLKLAEKEVDEEELGEEEIDLNEEVIDLMKLLILEILLIKFNYF